MQPMSQRTILQQKYNGARSNLLMMLILTTLNIVLFISGSGTMFLFSATVPYLLAIWGTMFWEAEPLVAIFFVIAAVILVLYLLCWVFSKKHFGWMIGALVLFVLDIAFMAGMYLESPELFSVLDAICHVWVLYYLIMGVSSGVKLKKLPADEPIVVEAEEVESIEGEPVRETAEETVKETVEIENSPALRRVDTEIKARILLEGDVNGRHVVFRRVKRINELVIGCFVYAEVEMLLEKPHALSAYMDGRRITVGLDAAGYSYMEVDGAIVERKLRRI